jgi:hypothetical protein
MALEFPDFGKHCFECNQLDFLPYDCKDCSHYYCSDHSLNKHPCIIKPILKKSLVTSSPILKKHFIDVTQDQLIKKYNCFASNCNKSTNFKDKFMKCVDCKQLCCVAHRHHDTHS